MCKITLEPEILVNDSEGIFIPHTFAITYNLPENFYNYSKIKPILDELSEPEASDKENYLELYDELLQTAHLLINHKRYYLYPGEGGLWAVPEGYKNDDFFI
jgi:hypothetical protein